MGSLSFAIARNWTLATAGVKNDIAAGQGLVRPHARGRPQTIALRLTIMYVFPMTFHLECVAQLVKTDSGLWRTESQGGNRDQMS